MVILSAVLISIGLFIFIGAAVGLHRFPDFYTRMHAAGKGDTLSSLLILAGFAIYHLHDFSLLSLLGSVKIMLICVFLFTTGPTTTHVLMEAGYETGVKPWERKKDEAKKEGESP